MLDPHDPASVHLLRARFGGLLARSARLLGGSLQIWSPGLVLVDSLPDRPAPAALALLRELAARAAMRHDCAGGPALDAQQLALPVRTRCGLVAVLTLHREGRGTRSDPPAGSTTPAEAAAYFGDLARVLSQHLDLLRDHAAQAGELLFQHAQQQVLRRVRRRLALPAEGRETLAFIVEQARAATLAQLALLSLADLPLLAAHGPAPAGAGLWIDPRLARELAGRLGDRLRATGEGILRGPLAALLRGAPPVPGPVHVLAATLRRGGRPEGFLALLRVGEPPFARQDTALLQALSEQILVAVRGGEADWEQSAFLLSTVRALVSAIEAKDPHTSGHSARVHLLAMLLGKELGLPGTEMEALQWASILHDVGKIGMPEAILHKEGPLTREEYEIIKTHPPRGYQVLHHIRPLQEASQSVLLHHERYGGGGYPLGLAGEGIPRAARIIAVADTFDALTSMRPYRPPRSEDEAFAEIARVRGAQLDPLVVDALETMLPFLRENLAMIAALPAA
ncbi:MAG: HD domain-containing protein [Candidatus Eisenbacteria bacterium]|uniref:HD domain-containing protein n=1 Tax=Eiseniibacteriota bacterium TaxID=2212470 RepID=A0A937X5N3_UNCEI|nr:HD domain-containing protein [Candidatus Eisenbacteria bacterium]